MSNPYPSTPSFGGASTPHPFTANDVPDAGFHKVSNHPSAVQQRSSYSAAKVTDAEFAQGTQKFGAGPHFSNSGHSVPPPIAIPPPPFPVPPDILKQFSNSKFPPPPYPPVPIPHLGISPFPQQRNISAYDVANGSQSQQQSQMDTPSNQTQEPKQNPHKPSREEGELSDGELDELPAESLLWIRRPDKTSLAVKNGEGHDAGESSAKIRSAAQSNSDATLGLKIPQIDMVMPDKTGNISQSHSDLDNHQATCADDESIASYNPPSASTPDSGEAIMDVNDQPPQISLRAECRKVTEVEESRLPYPILRALVKDALKSLQSHNIKYEDLVGEGVDAQFLWRLYEDLDQSMVHEKPTPPVAEQAPFPDAHVNARPSAQPLLPPASRSTEQITPPQHSEHIADPSPDSAPEPVMLEPLGVSSVPPVPSSSKIATAGDSMSEQPPMPPPPSIAAIERKDRIAQLLAAKTVKSTPTRQPLENSSQPAAKQHTPEPAAEAARKTPSPHGTPIPSLSEAAATTKNKAQNELIRQKMEALKRKTLAKPQTQINVEATSGPLPSASTSPLNPVQAQRATPVANVLENGSRLQIPGLFMADEEKVTGQGSEDAKTEKPRTGPVVEPIDSSPGSNKAGQGSSTDHDNDLDRPSDGRMLPARTPQKRPLASDSFDNSAPSLKRALVQTEKIDQVETIVSDTESGEVDDVEMDLDDDSEDEKSHPATDESAMALRDGDARKPSLMANLPRQSWRPTGSGAVTPGSTKAQLPAGKGKGESWKVKQQEIESMRRKIAELEEKRKAKQSGTPPASINGAGNAAPTVIRTSLSRPLQSASQDSGKPPSVPSAGPSSIALDSPDLAASRPEELPRTPSTPLHSLKEPLKADYLRQQLLRAKTTREGTPINAEVELRRAQLAEKRARLEELRQEAAKREAEIFEESRLLEAHVEDSLSEDEASDQPLYTADAFVQEGDRPTKQIADSLPPLNGDAHQDLAKYHVSAVRRDSPGQPLGSTAPATPDECQPRSNSRATSFNNESRLHEASKSPAIPASRTNGHDVLGEEREDLRDNSLGQQVETSTNSISDHTRTLLRDETTHSETQSQLVMEEDAGGVVIQPEAFDITPAGHDGSVSMSDSDVDDYEPAEPNAISQPMESGQAEEESESYEPAEVAGSANQPQPAFLQDETYDKNEANSPSFRVLPPVTGVNPDPVRLEDDVEDVTELTEPNIVNQVQTIPESHVQERHQHVSVGVSYQPHPDPFRKQYHSPGSHFRPYETPRRLFKNFRYYDRFPEIIPNGYKSWTFSNSIDPRKPFCPTELAGQECSVAHCNEQHFRQVGLTDDKILAQMSTADNLESNAERDRWVTGLRQVIADLRSQGVKDFHMVASALAAYRRRFDEELSITSSAPSQS